SGGRRAAARSALQGGVVGAAADRPAARDGGGRARAHRDARGRVGPRAGGGRRHARRPQRGASASLDGARAPRAGGERIVTAPRFQLADELLRRFAAALRSSQLYSKGHPIIGRNLEQLTSAFQLLHTLAPTTVIG